MRDDHNKTRRCRCRVLTAPVWLLGVLTALAATGVGAQEKWQLLTSDAGRAMEIDRASIRKVEDDKVFARGRMRFERPLLDAVSGKPYAILETHSHYDCEGRSVATVKRVYLDAKGSAFREEENPTAPAFPVRGGSMDDKIMKVACRPITPAEQKIAFEKTLKAANQVAASVLQELNEKKLRQELMRGDLGAKAAAAGPAEAPAPAVSDPSPRPPPRIRVPRPPVRAAPPVPPPPPPKPVVWAYAGAGAPAHWGALKPDYRVCGEGRRQSPIDLRDAIKVDLPPLEFDYRPTHFRVADTGTAIDVVVGDFGFTLLGKRYALQHLRLHRPAEEVIDGKTFPLGVHLVHRAADGELAVVAVVFEPGAENPVIQAFLNHLPLEKGREVAPPNATVDLAALLPPSPAYLTYLGSLTAPPCTEGVRWIVLRQPALASPAQIEIVGRLYPDNARPVQSANGRLIKESR